MAPAVPQLPRREPNRWDGLLARTASRCQSEVECGMTLPPPRDINAALRLDPSLDGAPLQPARDTGCPLGIAADLTFSQKLRPRPLVRSCSHPALSRAAR